MANPSADRAFQETIQLTPSEYEQAVVGLFRDQPADVSNLSIKHNQKLHDAASVSYQIDTVVEFDFMGMALRVIVEAKRRGRPVERGLVQQLRDTKDSVAAHKAVMVSTTGYQQGAIDYAKQHGVALIRFAKGEMTYQTKSMGQPVYEVRSQQRQAPPGLRLPPAGRLEAQWIVGTETGFHRRLLTGTGYAKAFFEMVAAEAHQDADGRS